MLQSIKVGQEPEGVKVSADGKTAYRIDDGIPVMLIERGIALETDPQGGEPNG